MYFLIGVCIFILFLIFTYLYFRIRIRRILKDAGFSYRNLKEIIEDARLEDQENPKSLASMDRIYLSQIKKDFIDININELKRSAEKVILDSYRAIESGDSSSLKGKIKSFVEKQIQEYEGRSVSFRNFKFHNTVVSNYQKENGIATIYFSSAFEYYLDVDGNSRKIQDRARCEFIYVIDESKTKDKALIGFHCPNCGSPISSLGEVHCRYCGSAFLEVFRRVFTCNDIVRY